MSELDKGGRPSKYSRKLCTEICDRIAEGETLTSICKEKTYPDKSTVIRWLMGYLDTIPSDEVEWFRNLYAQAREVQCEVILDEAVDIADDDSLDIGFKEDKDGNTTPFFDKQHVQRAKLRIDTRLDRIERLQPKKYGKKIQNENRNVDKDGNDIIPKSDDELNSRISELLGKVGESGAIKSAGRKKTQKRKKKP